MVNCRQYVVRGQADACFRATTTTRTVRVDYCYVACSSRVHLAPYKHWAESPTPSNFINVQVQTAKSITVLAIGGACQRSLGSLAGIPLRSCVASMPSASQRGPPKTPHGARYFPGPSAALAPSGPQLQRP